MRSYNYAALAILALGIVACSGAKTVSPLSIREVREQTEIYFGSDRYFITEQTAAAPIGEVKTGKSSSRKAQKRSRPVDTDFILKNSKDISVGVSGDAPAGRGFGVQNDDAAFVPASITKMLTTASALRVLGANFKFKTILGFEISPSGQAFNLIIDADGDPTIGAELRTGMNPTSLSGFAEALKSRGVKEIVGQVTLVSDDPRVDGAFYAQGIPNEDIRACYGAMASTFNINSNCALVRINPKTGFVWETSGISDFVFSLLETSPGGRNSLTLAPVLSDDRVLQGFTLRGSYLASAPKSLRLELPVANASGWYAQEFMKALTAAKIGVSKISVKLAASEADRTSALRSLRNSELHKITLYSPPLSQLVEATNKPSDNFLADAIFKAMGSKLREHSDSTVQIGSRRKVRESLDAWLRADGHANWTGDFVIYDGAGLSADNRATPRAFAAVLRQMAKEPTFEHLWQSLSIAGVDGTLGNRMRDTHAAGKVRGKTGTLSGAYQLIGYIPTNRSGTTEYIPFVILTSTTVRNRELVRRFQDAVVLKMYDAVNAF